MPRQATFALSSNGTSRRRSRYETVSDLRLRDSGTMSDATLPLGRRVLVSGLAGSGKRTFSRSLAAVPDKLRRPLLRVACQRVSHALCQREHDADRWIAATALRLGVPLVSNDLNFENTPGLVLEAVRA